MSSSPYGVSSGTAESFAATHAPEIRVIERRIGEFVTAWNKHDPIQMASLWQKDGDLINPFGRVAKGRDQVQKLFQDEHSGLTKNCTCQMQVTSAQMASDEVAVVDCESTMTGMRSPEGQALPTFKPHVCLVFTKPDGDWKVLCARPYAFKPSPGQAS